MDSDIVRLHDTVESFVSLVASTPAPRRRADGWGPREVLAHLVHWHEHYVRIVRARLEGREPRLPGGSFNALNAGAVERSRGVPVTTLLRRLERAERELERLSGRAAAARVRVRIKTGATTWPWRSFVRRVEAHVRDHERGLRRAARAR